MVASKLSHTASAQHPTKVEVNIFVSREVRTANLETTTSWCRKTLKRATHALSCRSAEGQRRRVNTAAKQNAPKKISIKRYPETRGWGVHMISSSVTFANNNCGTAASSAASGNATTSSPSTFSSASVPVCPPATTNSGRRNCARAASNGVNIKSEHLFNPENKKSAWAKRRKEAQTKSTRKKKENPA